MGETGWSSETTKQFYGLFGTKLLKFKVKRYDMVRLVCWHFYDIGGDSYQKTVLQLYTCYTANYRPFIPLTATSPNVSALTSLIPVAVTAEYHSFPSEDPSDPVYQNFCFHFSTLHPPPGSILRWAVFFTPKAMLVFLICRGVKLGNRNAKHDKTPSFPPSWIVI